MRNNKAQILLVLLLSTLLSGCIKSRIKIPTLLPTGNATIQELLAEINRLAQVASIRGRMDLKFEDTSFAEIGIAEKYKRADLELVAQRPGRVFLKIEVPFVKTSIAHMTSDGDKFRVAVLANVSDGKYKKFLIGSNSADYSPLRKQADPVPAGDSQVQSINAFSNVRPQHLTEAVLIRPANISAGLYVQSEFFQEETEINSKDEPAHPVLRGYYILDELEKTHEAMKISRRFWFDRSNGIRLTRQQVFDGHGNIDSDIAYYNEGNLGSQAEYKRMPLLVVLTRPKDKYKMSLAYQNPSGALVGQEFPEEAFVLKNSWNLPELDLDQKLMEAAKK